MMTSSSAALPQYRLPQYHWHGKIYKTMHGLFRAVHIAHPIASITFDKDAMHVRAPTTAYVYARSFAKNGDSIIADQPTRQIKKPYAGPVAAGVAVSG